MSTNTSRPASGNDFANCGEWVGSKQIRACGGICEDCLTKGPR